ncbi:MAG: hypothetical protein H6745_00450 [Deltaproteobacteria bacterium]|nr:hypothetical protein [Deltaproteobacteria bacterium]
MKNTAFAAILAIPAATCALAACTQDFPEKEPRQYGDFGTEAYGMLHNEFLWSGTQAEGEAKAAAFAQTRDDLVWALNTVAEAPVEDEMLPVLEAFLPLYDPRPDGTAGDMPRMTRDVADILDAFVADPRNLTVMAELDGAPAATPDAVEHLLGAVVRHPIALADRAIALTLDLEPELTRLFTYLHRELPTLEDKAPSDSSEPSLLQRLLAVNIEVTDEPIGPIALTARFDGRGAPVVRRLPTGDFPAPFVDGDGDGQVDVDDLGRPVDDLGVPIDLPTFAGRSTAGEERDAIGRPLVDNFIPYDYFNLRQTVVAYLMRDGRKLAADGVPYDLFTAFEALLGGRVQRDDLDGPYPGFYVEDAPLLDLLHVVNELRRYPRLVPLVRTLQHLVEAKPLLFRQLTLDFAKARKIFEGAPSLTPGNALFEDLHPALASLASHGLLRSMIAAARTPENQALFSALATQMRYTDMDFPSDMGTLTTSLHVDNLHFQGPTPWSQPDTTDAQRSWFQKACYLLWDTREAPVFLKLFDQQEIHDVQITNDMAKLYTNAIAGQAVIALGNSFLEDLAVQLVDEFDDLTPSAEQLNLFMNHDQVETGNPVCNQGEQVRDHYGKALLALQTSKGLASLRPWVKDIVAAGRQDDFVALLSTLAEHYSEVAGTTDGGFTSQGTGFRRIEPYFVRLVDETEFDRHFLELAAWADQESFTLDDGATTNVADELDRFLRWMLDMSAGVARRGGQTFIESKHGGIIEHPSRLQLLVDAFDRISAAMDADAEAKAAWDRVDLLGIFLDLDASGQALENKHALDVLIALVPILADEAADAIDDPDWDASIATFDQDAEDFFVSRGFGAAVDAMAKIRDTPAHRAFVDELLQAMLAEEPPSADTDLFAANLQVLSLVAQMHVPSDAVTQLLRFLGVILDPQKRYVLNLMDTLKRMRALDPEAVMTSMAKNLFVEPEVGRTPYKIIRDAVKRTTRVEPGSTAPYTAADFGEIMGGLRDWMRDDQKGMERLYDVILSR